jgi:hypothetical protein
MSEDSKQVRELIALINSQEMAKALAVDNALPPKMQPLSEKILPLWHQREKHARLLKANPQRAAEYWVQHARLPEQLVKVVESPIAAPPTPQEIVDRIEHRRYIAEINSRPLKRRV